MYLIIIKDGINMLHIFVAITVSVVELQHWWLLKGAWFWKIYYPYHKWTMNVHVVRTTWLRRILFMSSMITEGGESPHGGEKGLWSRRAGEQLLLPSSELPRYLSLIHNFFVGINIPYTVTVIGALCWLCYAISIYVALFLGILNWFFSMCPNLPICC